jgi:hypothetical protein
MMADSEDIRKELDKAKVMSPTIVTLPLKLQIIMVETLVEILAELEWQREHGGKR